MDFLGCFLVWWSHKHNGNFPEVQATPFNPSQPAHNLTCDSFLSCVRGKKSETTSLTTMCDLMVRLELLQSLMPALTSLITHPTYQVSGKVCLLFKCTNKSGASSDWKLSSDSCPFPGGWLREHHFIFLGLVVTTSAKGYSEQWGSWKHGIHTWQLRCWIYHLPTVTWWSQVSLPWSLK